MEFAGQQTGTPSNYDRFIAMETNGSVAFGVNGGLSVNHSPVGYNDGRWHQAVATFSAGAQRLYLDGSLVGSASPSSAENYFGYWRIGNGNLGGWGLTTNGFQYYGYLDEAAIWSKALTADEVRKLLTSQRCGLL